MTDKDFLRRVADLTAQAQQPVDARLVWEYQLAQRQRREDFEVGGVPAPTTGFPGRDRDRRQRLQAAGLITCTRLPGRTAVFCRLTSAGVARLEALERGALLE